MEREIKFRAKAKDDGMWTFGYYSPMYVPSSKNFREFIDVMGFQKIEIDVETLGQFTGMRDKNGKRIYEGDILISSGIKYKVIWSLGLMAYEAISYESTSRPLCDLSSRCCEVVGNIYDNPD